MLKTSKILPLVGIALTLLLAGCGSNDTAQQSQQPAPATSVSSSATPSATSSAESTAAPSEDPEDETSATPVAPTPTVIEADPTESTEASQPAPTGTVVTVEPTEEAAADQTNASADERTAAPSSAAGVAVCDYGQLYVAAAVSDGAGAAGSRYITLTFTNTGDGACSMSGYPAVHYVDVSGDQVGAGAAHASEWSSSGTVLAAGESTTATLRETRAQLFGDTCQSVPSAGYSVQAPGSSQALVLSFPAEACSNAGISQLSVGAVGANP